MTSHDKEMCSILNGTSNNYGIITFINIFKDSLPPNVIHPCPYNGRIKMENVTIDTSKIPSVFPSGSYRNRIIMFDVTDRNIFSVTIFTTCKSSIKTSY